jgi:hypothetical protein
VIAADAPLWLHLQEFHIKDESGIGWNSISKLRITLSQLILQIIQQSIQTFLTSNATLQHTCIYEEKPKTVQRKVMDITGILIYKHLKYDWGKGNSGYRN